MSTGEQEHKSKNAQITCAVAAFALAPVQSVLGTTAVDRFNALHNFNNGNSMKSSWFTLALLVFLTVSIAALFISTLYSRLQKRKINKTAEENEHKTEYRTRNFESPIEYKDRKSQGEKPKNNEMLSSNIEQRVSNIENRLSAIEQQLTNIDKAVSYFDLINDTNAETQMLATVEPGPSTQEDKK